MRNIDADLSKTAPLMSDKISINTSRRMGLRRRTSFQRLLMGVDMEKLLNFKILATNDLDQARTAVASTYLPNRLTKLSQQGFRSSLNAIEGYDVTVGYLTYRAEVNLQMPPSEDFYHVNLTVGGHTEAWRDDRQTWQTTGTNSGVVLLPDQLSRVTWSSDAEQVIFRFSRRRLENHLARLIGRDVVDSIHFDLGLDLRTPAGASLYSSAMHMVSELDRLNSNPGFAHMVRPMEELIMTQLLYTSEHNYRHYLDPAGGDLSTGGHAPFGVNDRRLEHVREYIESRLRENITLEEVAAVGSMSIRRLHALFRSTLETTPRTYILHRRLDFVRAELESASSSDSVSSIASRFGFTHLGRFAAVYRQKFGELPSSTLNRLTQK